MTQHGTFHKTIKYSVYIEIWQSLAEIISIKINEEYEKKLETILIINLKGPHSIYMNGYNLFITIAGMEYLELSVILKFLLL